KLDVGDPANAGIRTTYLKIFACPSNPLEDTCTVTDGGSSSWELAFGSYVACNGNDGVDDFTTPPHTGPFMRAVKGFRAVDITDGLSNTMFVGDRPSGAAVQGLAVRDALVDANVNGDGLALILSRVFHKVRDDQEP
ncbi:MAG TPA: DUF1559 domain-containing protein, partial [Gemmataceae bacterium]|nr:DUF1559 domain-containing protein [Gemmataceae bacterium]